MKAGQKFLWLLLASMTLFSFQNCGKSFKSATAESLSSSAQCNAKMREEVPLLKLSAAQLRCGDFNAYACERRIFSPDVVDLSDSIKECIGGGETCIDVDVRQFSTALARARGIGDPASFELGGDYNHEETHCYHRMVQRGISLFEGAADSIEESLSKAMAACEHAVGT